MSSMPSIAAFPRGMRQHTLKWVVVVLGAVVTLLLIGARPHETPATPSVSPAPESRTAAERDWNEQEDLKASRNMGQSGIY